MVEGVESFRRELELAFFSEVEPLLQAHGDVLLAGTAEVVALDDVAAGGAVQPIDVGAVGGAVAVKVDVAADCDGARCAAELVVGENQNQVFEDFCRPGKLGHSSAAPVHGIASGSDALN